MSVINIVKNIKQIHPEYIALIKIGKFYYSYGKDAYIISYIFNYKIKIVEENVCVCAFFIFITKKHQQNYKKIKTAKFFAKKFLKSLTSVSDLWYHIR